MKVYFIGICNKPGMKPLDSRTQSGMKIDKIIKQLPCECVKTNLCPTDYLLTDYKEIMAANLHWNNVYKPMPNDIVVLLGAWVQKNFMMTILPTVKLNHPSPLANRKGIDYVENAVKKIKEKLTDVI